MTQEQRFKVGDRVRTRAGWDEASHPNYIGVVGTVAEDDGSDFRPVRVALDAPVKEFGDTHVWAAHGDLESVAPAFKVGDRVRAPGYGHHWDDMTVERVLTGVTWPVFCRSAAGFAGGFGHKDLELIEQANPTFKVGDRVRSSEVAAAGTIFAERDGEFIIAWDSNTWSASDLYHVPPSPPLNPGVRVRITGGIAAGEEGVVIGIRGKQVNVRTDEHYMDNAGQLMRHVSASTAIVIPLQDYEHASSIGRAA